MLRVAAFEEHCWVLFTMEVEFGFPLDTYLPTYLPWARASVHMIPPPCTVMRHLSI